MNGKMLEDKSFSTTLYENTREYKAVLIPQVPSMRKFIDEVHLYFDKNSKLVVKVEMMEKGGDKTVIILTDYQVNTPIAENVFTDI
jgi:outer membrane lipoprotein carrier protein